MKTDNLDRLLTDLLHEEVERESFCLEGLEERIVTEMSGRLPRSGPFDLLKRLLAPTRGGRFAQVSVIGATAVIFLAVGIFLGNHLPVFAPALRRPAPVARAGENEILFVIPAPEAQSVVVVGSFNDWDATPLADADGDGVWTVNITLSPGRHEYAFVIDGRWWGHDPLADAHVRSFGEYNSVRYIGRVGDDV